LNYEILLGFILATAALSISPGPDNIFVLTQSITMIFSTIAVLAGTISTYILKTPKAGWFLKWLQIVVFVGIAIYLLLSDK